MSTKWKDNCWADKVERQADFEYVTDVELNQFLVFDHRQGVLRIYQDLEGSQKTKPFKVVRLESLQNDKIEGIFAHPLMTKKSYPYLIVQQGGSVSLIRTLAVANTVSLTTLKDETRRSFVSVEDRAQIVLHSNNMRGRRSSHATELHVFGCA
jgi:hypothetical protein